MLCCVYCAEPSDDAIKRTLDYLHDRAKGATYFTASDPGKPADLAVAARLYPGGCLYLVRQGHSCVPMWTLGIKNLVMVTSWQQSNCYQLESLDAVLLFVPLHAGLRTDAPLHPFA